MFLYSAVLPLNGNDPPPIKPDVVSPVCPPLDCSHLPIEAPLRKPIKGHDGAVREDDLRRL